MKIVILKSGHRGDNTAFVQIDSNLYDRVEDAVIVLCRRRQDRDMAGWKLKYALATVTMPADEEFA